MAIPFALSVVPPAMMGWMCEKREPEPMRSHCFALNRKALASKTNRGFFVTASVLGVASLICTVCSVVLEDANTKFAIVAVSATIAVLTACFTLPKPVALALLCKLLNTSAYDMWISSDNERQLSRSLNPALQCLMRL